MDTKSGGVNHVKKGAAMMGVEDSHHHADLDYSMGDMGSKMPNAHRGEIPS